MSKQKPQITPENKAIDAPENKAIDAPKARQLRFPLPRKKKPATETKTK